MLSYILRRLFWFIPVFFVVTALTFWTVRELPGGPFEFVGDRQLPEHVVRNIRRKYGLDQPIWQQYLNYLADLTRLDFGVSFKYRDREVSEVLGLKVFQILRAESEIELRRTEGGGLVVLDDLIGEQPLEPDTSLSLSDGTTVKYGNGQVVVERRKDVLLSLPLRSLPLTEGGLAVEKDGELVPLDENVVVELDDGTTVQREGEFVLARRGDAEVRLGETLALRLAVVTAAGEAEKLTQAGVGYGVGGDRYVRLAPDRADALVSEAVMRMTLQPVLVVRHRAGEVQLLEEGQPIQLVGGAVVVRRGGMVTLTTSMPADLLLETPSFDIPVERMLAVGDGRGNLVPLDLGVKVVLPDGTEVSGQGTHVLARNGDFRLELAEGSEGNLVVREGDKNRALSENAIETNGLLVLVEEENVFVMQEIMRVPLVRMLGVELGDGTEERLDEGKEVELIDGTRLVSEGGQLSASRGRARIVLGWTKAGRLAVIEDRLVTEIKEGQRVELDKFTYVTTDRDVVLVQRRLDLPVKYVLHPQEDGGWTATAAGQDEPLALEDGKEVEFPGDLSVVREGDVFQAKIRRVLREAKTGLPISAALGLFAMAIAVGLGIPLGIVAALRHNTIVDYGATLFAIIGRSIPNMVLGPLLILLFVHSLDWLDLTWAGSFRNYILPAFALGTGMSATIARLTRASLLQVVREDYIRTAYAKGLAGRTVVVRHALKNSLIPVVTILGPMFAAIVTGTLVIEQIFAIPGMGKHFVTSIGNRDYPIVMAVTIIYAVLIVLANLAVDITYGMLDPRIRYQ